MNDRTRFSPRLRRPRQAGFTLPELMAVVVIVGILAAIAWPGYQEQARKSRRADAKNALMTAAGRQEQFILDRNTYTTDMRELGYSSDPGLSENGYYQFDAVAGSCGSIGRCYVLTATPRAGAAQAADSKCTSFSVDSAGARTATGSLGNDCW